jgi:hypothetical protein
MKGLLNYLNQLAKEELQKPTVKRKYGLSASEAKFTQYKYHGTIREYKPGKWMHEIKLVCEKCIHWDCCEDCLE